MAHKKLAQKATLVAAPGTCPLAGCPAGARSPVEQDPKQNSINVPKKRRSSLAISRNENTRIRVLRLAGITAVIQGNEVSLLESILTPRTITGTPFDVAEPGLSDRLLQNGMILQSHPVVGIWPLNKLHRPFVYIRNSPDNLIYRRLIGIHIEAERDGIWAATLCGLRCLRSQASTS